MIKKFTVQTFVYGTLRIGEGNYMWASEDVIDEVRYCKSEGGLYYVNRSRGFPVADFTEKGSMIEGDLLTYEIDSPCLLDVMGMEIGAGYTPAEVLVVKPNGTSTTALAWHWPHPFRGERIKSGDWCRENSWREG